jgi:hypothetical protein
VSPILVRPVREQLEHDRVIRLLPGRYKRRFEVGINPGPEQNAAIGTGTSAVYPDAVLYSTEKARKIQGVVEVETVESINHLEVMSQWGPYSRLKIPFHLYVPVAALDVARRLSSDHHVAVSEIWSYDNVGDQVRFTLVHKVPETTTRSIAAPPPAPAKPDTVKPAVVKPAPAKPIMKPALMKPAQTKPAVVKPAVVKPAAAKPSPVKPVLAPIKAAGSAAKTPAVKAKVAPPPPKKPASKAAKPAPPATDRKPVPAAAKPARPAPAPAKAAVKRAPAAARGRAPAPARKPGTAPKRK